MATPVMPSSGRRVWGFDIGIASIGWAVTRQESEADALVDAGVRIFPAAVEGGESGYASGRGESTNAARQLARTMRRQRRRRRVRLGELARLLQARGLLPVGNLDAPAERDLYFKNLDHALRPPPTAPTIEQHTWLHRLFARGLAGEPLPAHALGRVLYHAAQLRGFKSNAKERAKAEADKETGKVYGGIKDTRALMAKHDAKYLAQSFAQLDPELPGERIRGRHTSRQDREAGVKALLEAQAPHHADKLTPEAIKEIRDTIFFQKDFKQNTSKLVGLCALYPDQRRAIMALPSLQRLRVLQKVNDLEITLPGKLPQPLSPDDRRKVRDHLLAGEDLTLSKLRALLNLPKPRKTADGTQPPFAKINLESDERDDRLVGDRTHRHLAPVLGEVWTKLSLEERDAFVEEIFAHDDEEHAKAALAARYGLTPEIAEQVIEAAGRLETDRARFCAAAARALCAALDTDADPPVRLQTAMKELRAKRTDAPDPAERVWDRLPPLIKTHDGVDAVFPDPNSLRNPVVLCVLRELRLVVNALLRKHGKPDLIRIELARDLKKPRAAREEIAKQQKERAADRERARKALVELGIPRPSEADKEKWLLGEECGWHCPYTGEPLPPRERVFARDSDVHIEHIIPRHRSLDNSFANKTLATARANSDKAERAPHAAFSGNPQRWHEILVRVAAFHGPGARGKLASFKWAEEEIKNRYDDFSERHLRDTAYATRLAKDYLARLFGSSANDPSVDATGSRRIETVAGRATSLLAHAWGLYQVLLARPDLPALPPPADDAPKPRASEKFRADHRHHALDAIAVAFTTPTAIHLLSSAIQSGHDAREFTVDPPIADLRNQTAAILERMIVSHRVSRRASGALHQATYYQAPRADGRRFQRKALEDFNNAEDFTRIVDPRIQAAVLAAWERRGQGVKDPSVFFKTPENLPRLSIVERRTGAQREIAIRAVTVPIDDIATVALGAATAPSRQLHVKTGDNFCVAIIAVAPKTAHGKEQLRLQPISRLDAARLIAQRKKQPPLRTAEFFALAAGERLLFTIRSSEVLRLHAGKHTGLFLVGTASDGLEVTRLNDARTDATRKGNKRLGIPSDRIRLSASSLMAAKAEKVSLGPLGEVFPARD